MLVLGIETSCDETAVALVEDGHSVRANVISSQIAKHAQYGGVVPELAAREHLKAIDPVVNLAFREAGAGIADLDAVGVTNCPGLIPALLVGVSYAKGIAAARGIPVVGVNHFLAHIFGAFIDRPARLLDAATFPVIALVVSGGHTALALLRGEGDCRIVGTTLDDAAGEAFDKAAKILHLSYPGGPVIDKLSQQGDPGAVAFPIGLAVRKDSKNGGANRLNFSFSGVKTSLLYYLKKHGYIEPPNATAAFSGGAPPDFDDALLDVVASYQEAVVDALVQKTLLAAADYDAATVVVCGGVACNSRLRHKMAAAVEHSGRDFIVARPEYCTDNGAMIGGLAYYYVCNSEVDDFSLDAGARLMCIDSIPVFAGTR